SIIKSGGDDLIGRRDIAGMKKPVGAENRALARRRYLSRKGRPTTERDQNENQVACLHGSSSVAEIPGQFGVEVDEIVGIESTTSWAMCGARCRASRRVCRIRRIENCFVMSRRFPDERAQAASVGSVEDDVVDLAFLVSVLRGQQTVSRV